MQARSVNHLNPVIMVVDDTPANLTLLRNILEPEGYKVLLATSGEKALELLNRITPDLILLDVMMPGLDGFATITRIKQLPSAKDVPVIFVTAKAEQADIVKGFECGAVDYITKPVQQLETLARVQAHLRIQHLLQVERRQAEQIRAVINNITDCIVVIDKEGFIQSANPATEHLLGYCQQALCQKHIAEIFNFDGEPSAFLEILMHHQDNHPWWRYPCGVRADDKKVPVDVNIREMFTKEPSYVVVIQDISLYRHEIDQLHQLSETDPLTNIHNRRYFEILLEQSWQHCKRNLQGISLLFVDVDYFKAYNDCYGHQEGDSCLKLVAKALNGALSRGVDSVSRYGGEEFVAILPDCHQSGAVKVAENMLNAVRQLNIEHRASEFQIVTVSIGVASCDHSLSQQPIGSTKALLAQADKALYHAKSGGRNRLEII